MWKRTMRSAVFPRIWKASTRRLCRLRFVRRPKLSKALRFNPDRCCCVMAMNRSGVQMSRVVTSFFLALASKLKGGGVIINGHTLTRSQTRLQLETLGRWFDFIGLEELPVRLNRAPGRPFCLLTFDDGKRNNFTEIAPELERARVPAVFYVTTEPLSSGACLWFDQRSQLITHLG